MKRPLSPQSATHRTDANGLALSLTLSLTLSLAFASCGDSVPFEGNAGSGTPAALVDQGRSLFRDGTLGTEGFWSDVAGLDSGLSQAGFSTLDALELGLQIDADAVDAATLDELLDELDGGLAPGNVETLTDPLVFEALLSSSAIVGLVGIDADSVQGIKLDGPDRIGISCALCHSVVDGSTFDGPALAGAIGRRIDGPAPTNLRVGAFLAFAERSSALYPYLTQSHATIGGFPIGRTEAFVEATSTEAEFDALLRDGTNFPAGQWDATPDGIGNPVVLPPLFDIRAAAPYGIAGEFDDIIDAINAHVTLGLDPTTLLTTPGRVFMNRIGIGVGTEIVNEYADVFAATGAVVPAGGLPYVDAIVTGFPGAQESPLGLVLDSQDLRALASYLLILQAPSPLVGNAAARARGSLVFAESCASCHGPIGSLALNPAVSLLDLIVPYAPSTLLARGFPFSDIIDDRLRTYDDRLVIFDRLFAPVQVPLQARDYIASNLRGLQLQSSFLHDGSVPSLMSLFDSTRGASAPHPFYQEESASADLVEFLTTR